ncbi:MAG: chloramphenicol phosphotransferase [Patescibacteria group bacterium]
MQEKYGKIIFLNGASSSGKTSIATLLQQKIELPFWHISIDHLRDAGVLPLERIRSGEFNWQELRESFFSGFHHSLPQYAKAGNNLIIEHIIETQEWKQLLTELLKPFDVFYVCLHCELGELERRENHRSDRPIGDARKDFEVLQTLPMHYDLEVNAELPVEENVDVILSQWRLRSKPELL